MPLWTIWFHSPLSLLCSYHRNSGFQTSFSSWLLLGFVNGRHWQKIEWIARCYFWFADHHSAQLSEKPQSSPPAVSSSSPKAAWRSTMVSIPQPDPTHQRKRQLCSWKIAHDISEELHGIMNMHICCRHGREKPGPPDKGGAHEGTTEETEWIPWPLESLPQSLSAKKQMLEKTFLKGLGE